MIILINGLKGSKMNPPTIKCLTGLRLNLIIGDFFKIENIFIKLVLKKFFKLKKNTENIALGFEFNLIRIYKAFEF